MPTQPWKGTFQRLHEWTELQSCQKITTLQRRVVPALNREAVNQIVVNKKIRAQQKMIQKRLNN